MKFTSKWEDKRTPVTVKFPDGTERRVSYMRDGLILFTDNFSCGYERKSDFEAEINLPESDDEVKDILKGYWDKAPAVGQGSFSDNNDN